MSGQRFAILGTLAVLTTGTGCRSEQTDRVAVPAAAVSVADVGLRAPESVVHDAVADVYLVANINGAPLAKDGNGFISRLSPDGTVLALKWIDGAADGVTLHAPKGMAIRRDSLFVADIDALRIFDRLSGAPVGTWQVEGATFLNDVTVAADGTVYATDSGFRTGAGGIEPSGTDAVIRFESDGTPVQLVSGAGLGGPNGIVAHEGRIIVVTTRSGRLLLVEDESGTISGLPAPPAGSLDGIVVTRDGDYLVSSWEGQAVYHSANGVTYDLVVDSVPTPAAIGYDATRHRVMIPLLNADRVEIRALP
jgi:sugar lactone lactonase YvrE